jgi:hypothetical protein
MDAEITIQKEAALAESAEHPVREAVRLRAEEVELSDLEEADDEVEEEEEEEEKQKGKEVSPPSPAPRVCHPSRKWLFEKGLTRHT